MKKNLIAIASMSLLGLACSTSAMAGLKSFDKSVGDDYYCGYKNDAGKIVIPANKYQGCGEFSDGLAYVGHIAKPLVEYETGGYKHVQGFIDQTGKLVIPVKYEVEDGMEGGNYKSFSNGMVSVFKNGKHGFMNKDQKLVVPHKYDYVLAFNDGVAVVQNDGLFGVIDKTGKVIVPIDREHIGSFSNGLATTSVTDDSDSTLYGYINKTGKVAIVPNWGQANQFSEGLAVVRFDTLKSSKWGVIDTKGKYVIQPKYDEVIPRIDNDSQSFESAGQFNNGKATFYTLVTPSKPQSSKITRSIVDKTGKVLSTKTFNNWEAAAKDFR